MIIYTTNREPMLEIIESISEILSDSEISEIDMPMRAIIAMLE